MSNSINGSNSRKQLSLNNTDSVFSLNSTGPLIDADHKKRAGQ